MEFMFGSTLRKSRRNEIKLGCLHPREKGFRQTYVVRGARGGGRYGSLSLEGPVTVFVKMLEQWI